MTLTQLAGPECAQCFEKEYINKFRDCLTFYYDGRVRFERFCYGEGACLVYAVWGTLEGSTICYQQPFDPLVDASALPHTLTSNQGDILFFDDARWKWEPQTILESDPKNGYSKFRMLLKRLFKK